MAQGGLSGTEGGGGRLVLHGKGVLPALQEWLGLGSSADMYWVCHGQHKPGR